MRKPWPATFVQLCLRFNQQVNSAVLNNLISVMRISSFLLSGRDFFAENLDFHRKHKPWLFASVKSGDSTSSRTAFVASAEALEKWTRLTGLSEKVVGL